MSYHEKQQECKRRGLPATGKDKDLLQRLLGSSGSEQAKERGELNMIIKNVQLVSNIFSMYASGNKTTTAKKPNIP